MTSSSDKYCSKIKLNMEWFCIVKYMGDYLVALVSKDEVEAGLFLSHTHIQEAYEYVPTLCGPYACRTIVVGLVLISISAVKETGTSSCFVLSRESHLERCNL